MNEQTRPQIIKIGNKELTTKNLIIVGNKTLEIYLVRATHLIEIDKNTEIIIVSISRNIFKINKLLQELKKIYGMYVRDRQVVKDDKGDQFIYYVTM